LSWLLSVLVRWGNDYFDGRAVCKRRYVLFGIGWSDLGADSRSLMHGVAPRMCDQVVLPLLDQGAGGRSPGFPHHELATNAANTSALRLAIISVALVVPLAGARADDASVELTRIIQDNANRQAVIEIAREQNGQLPDACDSATYTDTSHPVALSPPQVDGTGKLIGGAWLQSVIATGCETRRQLNILTLAQQDGMLRPHYPITWNHDRGSTAPAAGGYQICDGWCGRIDARLPDYGSR
jgi:hypothetical protein